MKNSVRIRKMFFRVCVRLEKVKGRLTNIREFFKNRNEIRRAKKER